MKKYLLIMLVVLVGLSLTGIVSAADVDKDAIKAKVDEIAVAIEGGKPASDFADAANLKPHYVYIMQEDGKLLVHPSLVGKNLKEAAMPAFEAVSQATMEGGWVKYEWKGAEKNAYVRKTKTGVIVGSGY
jgi:hypothetical protein